MPDVLAIKLRTDVAEGLAELRSVGAELADIGATTARATVSADAAPALDALARVGAKADRTRPKLSPKGTPQVRTAPATSRLRKLGRLADKTMAKLAGIGKTALKWGGAALTAGSIVASVAVVKLGADMQQTRLSLQTMMRDAQAGNAMLARLNEFSNVTPFQNAEVIGAGKTLMAFGVEAESLMGLLKQIGDVSAGTGKPLGELAAIIGKVMAKGKADTEALNQMTEAGIPIIKTLAAQYGVSGAAIYKMAEKGRLSSDVITSAFAAMSGAGGMFENMMEKQAGTVGGVWSTIVGKLKLTAATLGEQLAPALQIGLSYIQGWIEKLGEIASDGSAAAWLVDFGVQGIDTFGAVLVWVNRFWQSCLHVFRTLRSAATVAFEGLQYIITAALVNVMEVACVILGKVSDAYNRLRALVGRDPVEVGFSADLEALKSWRDSSKQFMIEAGKEMAGSNMDRMMEADEAFTAKIDAAREKLQAAGKRMQKAIKEGIEERRGDGAAAMPKIDAPKIPEIPEVKIKSRVEKPNLDALTKIGLYNFNIPAFGQAGAPAGGGAAAAGPGATIAAPAAPTLDKQRNGLLQQIRDLVRSVAREPSYRLA